LEYVFIVAVMKLATGMTNTKLCDIFTQKLVILGIAISQIKLKESWLKKPMVDYCLIVFTFLV